VNPSYFWILFGFIFCLSACVQKTESSLSYSSENFPEIDFTVNGGVSKVSDAQVLINIISRRTDLKSYSISSGSLCESNVWQELTNSIPFNLSIEDGGKNISIKVKTVFGFESRCVTKKIILDKTPSDILSVTPPNSGEYGVGQGLEFKVNLREKGNVIGLPRIKIRLGADIKYAEYITGSGTQTLVFRYSPVAGDEDWDGVEIVSPIEVTSAQVFDEPGNKLNLNFTLPDLSDVLVHTSPKAYAVFSSSLGSRVFDEFQGLLRFNKIVSNLDKTKFIVTNGEVTSLMSTKDASSYSLYVKPTSTGEVKILLPADAVQDAQQLGNLASSELKVQYEMPNELSVSNEIEIVSEGNSSTLQRFLITLNGTKPYATEVTYAVLKSSTAVYGRDHDLPLSGAIVIPANTSSVFLSYRVFGNTISEPDRVLGIQILKTSSYGVQVSKNQQAYQIIKDDDSSPKSFFAVAAGAAGERDSHSCAISNLGVLTCWGSNLNGQLGNGTNLDSSSLPLFVDLGTSYSAISAGGGFTCGITTGKDLKCWGKNNWGQTGDFSPTKFSPTLTDSESKYKSISAGFEHACGITEVGSLRCWGRNTHKQLGRATTLESDGPGAVDSGTSYISVAAGGYHTCGITTNNDLKCWGSRKGGSDGQTITLISTTPTSFDSSFKYSEVSSGLFHSCGIRQNGDLTCWGFNDRGQIGDNTNVASATPVLIDVGEKYKKVFLGQNHSCAITTSSKLKCWGNAGIGGLGDGSHKSRLTPIQIDPTKEYSQISAALEHTCGLTSGQVLNCWGYNFWGELGSGRTAIVQEPTIIETTKRFKKLSVGWMHSCGISIDGELYCWGNIGDVFEFNGYFKKPFPVRVDPETLYNQISSGFDVTCGVTQKSVLKCWGRNGTMILGDGTLIRRRYPVVVDSGTKYSKVTVGEDHACGITVAGVIKCWGSNGSAAIGQSGLSPNEKTPPISIAPGSEFMELSSGDYHNCAITKAGELSCWGYNGYGAIGDGTKTTWDIPSLIDSGVSYSYIHAGFASTCGITHTGRVKCWGGDHMGQLGNGSQGNASTPQEIADTSTYQEIDAGSKRTCGLTQSGVIKCWGGIPSELGQGIHNYTSPWPVIPK